MNTPDGFTETASGLSVPAAAITKRRIVLGLGVAERLQRTVRDLAKHGIGLTMVCTKPECKADPVCVRSDEPHRTILACGCTERVIVGGL